MCNWNTYTFECGCLEVGLRSRCQSKRADDELDPCLWMQRVSPEWRFHQKRLCDRCDQRERDGELIQRRWGQDGLVVGWDDVGFKAHALAVRMAEARQIE